MVVAFTCVPEAVEENVTILKKGLSVVHRQHAYFLFMSKSLDGLPHTHHTPFEILMPLRYNTV